MFPSVFLPEFGIRYADGPGGISMPFSGCEAGGQVASIPNHETHFKTSFPHLQKKKKKNYYLLVIELFLGHKAFLSKSGFTRANVLKIHNFSFALFFPFLLDHFVNSSLVILFFHRIILHTIA